MPDTQASIPLVCDEQWTVEEHHTTLILKKCSHALYHKRSMLRCSFKKCFYSNSMQTYVTQLCLPYTVPTRTCRDIRND